MAIKVLLEPSLECPDCGKSHSFRIEKIPSNPRCAQCGAAKWAARNCPSCSKLVIIELAHHARLQCPECDVQWTEVMEGPQSEFVQSKAKYPGLFSGRGGGKTVADVVKAFSYVFEHPGARGILTEPTYGLVDSILIPAIRDVYGHVENSIWELKVGKYEIRFGGAYKDSIIYLRPGEEADKVGIGTSIAFFGMDEVKVGHQHETFKVLLPSLRQKGFPAQGWVTSTPDWRKPWIRKRWHQHINPNDGSPLSTTNYPTFRADTEDNWHLPDEYLGLLWADYGDTRYAAQELHGEFVIVEGAGFPMFKPEIHIASPPPDTEFIKTVAGLDFGLTAPTSMHELRLDRSRKVWVTREFYKRNADVYDWVSTAVEWGVKKIPCDPSLSEQELQRLKRLYNIPLKRAKSKRFRDRVEAIEKRLTIREDRRPGMYISPACPNLIDEIQNAAYDQPRGQEYEVDKWMSGVQDHALDGVGYGAMEFDSYVGSVKLPRFVRNLS